MTTPHTVATLRAALASLPDDLPIILSSDEEGNRFAALADVEFSKCVFDNGDPDPIHPDDVQAYEPEELTDVVVLWP